MSVFRSSKHIYAQVVDDRSHQVVTAASTRSPSLRDTLRGLKKTEQAKKVGVLVAQQCKDKGVLAVAFDRNGFRYHGRVKALADAAREAGLKF
jgi:large subunit ribosomal protein L18